MEFAEALSIVNGVIPESEGNSYDGIFVKDLKLPILLMKEELQTKPT